jgi:hypothetical protein
MSDNTWPGGRRHAMDQSAHEKWNAIHYPGTRQLCVDCGEATGFCEEDSLYAELNNGDGHGPLCIFCHKNYKRDDCDD